MLIRTAIASATTVALAVGVGVTVGFALDQNDDGLGSTPDRPAPGTFVLANSSLKLAPDCDSLLDSYVDRGLDLVTAYGWGGGGIVMFDSDMATSSGAESSTAKAPVPTTVRSTNNETGTNVQEAGVDEPDVVKVVGDKLFRIQDNVLTTYDVAGDEPQQLSSLQLPDLRNGEILVSGDRVVVLGDLGDTYETTGARIVVIDASQPGTPQIVEQTDYTATISAARLHGDVVRVVLDNALPQLDFRYPDGGLGEQRALERNQELVRETTLADWLPTVAGEPVVDCDDVALPTMETALGTTTVVSFEAAVVEPTTTAVATTATTSYFSPDRFYLAASASPFGWWGDIGPMIDCIDRCEPSGAADGSTELFAFALDGTDTTYVASGTVEGQIKDRWSMDYAGGALRVALGATNETGNFNSVVTMRETDATLSEIGRVDKLGIDEEIKSVRWFDDLAIVVTFRQTDPLYAIDLSDPENPLLMGELKIPGYSEYLHPLGGRRMIGIGQDASLSGMVRGAQAALFDVTDLTNPEQLDVVTYPKYSQAGAGLDPRQFTWLPDRRTALTVVSQGWKGRTGWVSVLTLDGGTMTNRLVEVEYGDEIAQVRLVPLADGRVVLVTGDAVSFFDLS